MGEFFVHTAELKPGMKLSRPFFTRQAGAVLFVKNFVFDEASIEKAIKSGVGLACVYDGEDEAEMAAPSVTPKAGHSAGDYIIPQRAGKVLVVDDEPDICNYIKEIVTDRNYSVVTAGNAYEAWNHLASDPHINTVFLDIKMPEVNGFELLKVIKNQIPRQVEVIMVTASRSVQDVILASQLGASDFVTKPFEPDRLMQTLESKSMNRAAY